MKRITFLAAFIVALMSFSAAKAQVSGHIGINIGSPAYYPPPPRVVVVDRAPVYDYPVRRVYYDRPVVIERRGYYAPRRVIVRDRFYGHPGRGYWNGRGHGRGRW